MYCGHMGALGGFGMILLWGLFIWLIVWVISQNKNSEDPKKTLKNRLASGEISSQEYDRLIRKIKD